MRVSFVNCHRVDVQQYVRIGGGLFDILLLIREEEKCGEYEELGEGCA